MLWRVLVTRQSAIHYSSNQCDTWTLFKMWFFSISIGLDVTWRKSQIEVSQFWTSMNDNCFRFALFLSRRNQSFFFSIGCDFFDWGNSLANIKWQWFLIDLWNVWLSALFVSDVMFFPSLFSPHFCAHWWFFFQFIRPEIYSSSESSKWFFNGFTWNLISFVNAVIDAVSHITSTNRVFVRSRLCVLNGND